MIERLAHACISTTDLTLTERFYCSGLGFRKIFDFIRGGEVVGFYLEVSEKTYIEVFRQDEVDAHGKCPISHICFDVSDIDEVYRHMKSRGYDTTEKKLGADHSWRIWTTDPSGVRVEFQQYTEQSCQVTAKNCMLD